MSDSTVERRRKLPQAPEVEVVELLSSDEEEAPAEGPGEEGEEEEEEEEEEDELEYSEVRARCCSVRDSEEATSNS